MSLEALKTWYIRNRRNLPWREHPGLWEVLVSEVMLQQTKVETVIDAYQRFLQRFPTPCHLATSPESEILQYWSGLGYYNRARRLHSAAVMLSEGFQPRDRDDLLKLPGVGSYTAAAIASIVLHQAVVVLDGNVQRVASRYFGFEFRSQSKSAWNIYIAALCEELLCPLEPGLSNQALMELGSLVCRPTRPECTRCPLQPRCHAAVHDEVVRYPPPQKKPAPTVVWLHVYLEQENQELVFVSRGWKGYQKSFWHLPFEESEPQQIPQKPIQEGYQVLGNFSHAITRYRIEVHVYAQDGIGPALHRSWPKPLATVSKKALNLAIELL